MPLAHVRQGYRVTTAWGVYTPPPRAAYHAADYTYVAYRSHEDTAGTHVYYHGQAASGTDLSADQDPQQVVSDDPLL
jgi:hypothetical protein